MRVSRILTLILLLALMSLVTLFMMPATASETLVWIARLSGILALALLLIFYRNIMKPLQSLSNGVDLIRAQDFSSRLAHVNQREADQIIEMFNGMMTALKEERLHMREQNHFLDLLIAVSPMGIIILDEHDHIVNINPAASLFLESGKNHERNSLCDLSLSQLNSQLGRTIAALQTGETETIRMSDSMIYRCSRLSFMDKGFSHPFILIEKLTDEVMKAEKKSYEKVIRVIAHEVNNTMAGVNSMLSTASLILKEDPGTNADLLEVMKVCDNRCHSLSKFITAFADVVKIPEITPVTVDLNKMVEQWRVMLESLCSPRRINFTLHLSDSPVMARIDTVLMEQVLINIVKNSAESIDADGDIDISTSSAPSSIVVTDNGAGISEEAARMLFSPFFSTKANGHGIGLLFTSEVLHKHSCRFSLRTGDDNLTRFSIEFPT